MRMPLWSQGAIPGAVWRYCEIFFDLGLDNLHVLCLIYHGHKEVQGSLVLTILEKSPAKADLAQYARLFGELRQKELFI